MHNLNSRQLLVVYLVWAAIAWLSVLDGWNEDIGSLSTLTPVDWLKLVGGMFFKGVLLLLVAPVWIREGHKIGSVHLVLLISIVVSLPDALYLLVFSNIFETASFVAAGLGTIAVIAYLIRRFRWKSATPR